MSHGLMRLLSIFRIFHMKVQAVLLSLGLIGASACALAQDAAKPAAANPPAKTAAQDARWKAAEALTQEQIKATTDRSALTKLAELYNGRDFDRFRWALERLSALMPDSGELKLQLATVYASRDMKSEAYDSLMRLQLQGFGYDLATDPRFEKVHGTRVWTYIVENLKANAKPFGEGKVAFKLPQGDRLLETLDYDAKRKKFLVGSAREGAVYLAGKDGKLEDFIAPAPKDGLWSVLGLRADAAHDALWVLSSGVPVYKGYDADMVGKSWLLKYQLSSGKLLAKYAPPEAQGGHVLTELVVGKDGRVYVVDGVRREFYKLDGEKLQLLTANPRLSSITGLTLSGDGSLLYFADPTLGLFGLDLATGKPFALAHNPERLVVGGIASLYWYDGTLAIVQAGMMPQRVMRLKLTPDGHAVSAVMPLDVANADFALPAQGTVVGDELYFLANSQKVLYDSYGVLRDAAQLEAPAIFKSNLRYAWDESGIAAGVEDAKKDAPKAPAEEKK
jgi:hypothetical protein